MKVYIANIESVNENLDGYVTLLHKKQQVRANKYQNQTRKLQFVLGHLMVVCCGKTYTSMAYKDKFVVVAAASNAPVGIDIENVTIECNYKDDDKIDAKSLNDYYKQFARSKSIYKLGVRSKCVRFMRYQDYLICVSCAHYFDMPKLHKFDLDHFVATSPRDEIA